MEVTKSRVIALEVLEKVDKWRGFADELVNSTLRRSHLEPRDRHLVTELVQGCLRWRMQLDFLIWKFAHKSLTDIDSVILNILRLGTYQLLFLDRVPASAAVNESVNLSRQKGQASSVAFVNAMLRKISQEGFRTLKKKLKDPVYELALRTSHPDWLVRKWVDRFGLEKARLMLEANNIVPPMCIRVNTLKTDKYAVKEILENEGLLVTDGNIAPDSMYITGRTLPPDHRLLKDGMIHIQDEASQMIPLVLNPDSTDYVLDTCAAPGVKTTQMGAMMKNQGRIVAWDSKPLRIREMENNCNRMGVENVITERNDATKFDPRFTEYFDKILVDAPCSALGIIRRHPEIKWSRKEGDFVRHTNLQLNLLDICSKYLKKSGVLTYSVCSTEPEEGEEVIDMFLEQHPEMQLVTSIFKTSFQRDGIELHRGWFRTYPPEWDGFFVAKLQKDR